MVSLGRSTRNAALDCKLHMLTETGDDAVGEMIISFMEANGIDSSFAIRRSGRQTPISIALLDGRADARYEFFRDPVPQSIGIFAIPEMGRFYRHVLVEKNYPHHGAVAFGHFGKALYEVFKYLGIDVEEIDYNQPKGVLYPTENPFA